MRVVRFWWAGGGGGMYDGLPCACGAFLRSIKTRYLSGWSTAGRLLKSHLYRILPRQATKSRLKKRGDVRRLSVNLGFEVVQVTTFRHGFHKRVRRTQQRHHNTIKKPALGGLCIKRLTLKCTLRLFFRRVIFISCGLPCVQSEKQISSGVKKPE